MELRKLYLLCPLLGAAAFVLSGCQTAVRPVSLLPASASAPAIVAPQPAKPAAKAPSGQESSAATPVKAPQAAPAKSETTTAATDPTDPVELLISQAEKEYKAGLENYKAGHLAAAKQNFDQAFDLLLTSPLNVKSDERLQAEFDHIVEGTSNLEMAALEQGDGFTEQQQSEPAPIDEANEVTFPVDPNVKAIAEAEVKVTRSDLPLMLTDPVLSYLNYFSTRGKPTIQNALVRAGRYQDMIRRVLREEGVPEDLIYLAQAESGFHPLALSRAGARGMWQFIASRARGYNLERNWWVDDRQDPEKATRAAARHLRDLYHQFGDWYLAMAAYNSGPGTVQSAVKRTGYADFWELYRRNVLPKETRNYVPIIVAVTIMAKNPSQYGLDHLTLEEPMAYDTVKIHYPVDLRLVAECVDASVTSLQELNPSLLRLTTPRLSLPNDNEFELHLPVGTKDKFVSAVAAIPQEMRVWWRYHKVENGETLASLAHTYHTSTDAISEANNLSGEDLTPDSKIIIPIAPGKIVPGETGDVYSKRAVRYKVRKGDTVATVAEDYSVPAERIRHWNHLRGDHLRRGQTLRIYPPMTATATGSGRSSHEDEVATRGSHHSRQGKTGAQAAVAKNSSKKDHVLHKVRKGETLYSIASSYNTTVSALRRDNHKAATNLHPGDVLVVKLER